MCMCDFEDHECLYCTGGQHFIEQKHHEARCKFSNSPLELIKECLIPCDENCHKAVKEDK